MKVGTFIGKMLPVIAGVVVAGLIMNAGRDLPIIGSAIDGFDS